MVRRRSETSKKHRLLLPAFYQFGDTKRWADEQAQVAGEPYRTEFRRDYARIIHSPVFRRLQRKTQLFPGDESDFFRNRLTHSLEVAQIAKSIAIRLNWVIAERYGKDSPQIDLDLVEFAGLTHDIGHPPFGHTGEHALHECMSESGGFEGNAQTLRIVCRLEKRKTFAQANDLSFTEFKDGEDLRAGLNLCFRSMASVLKYDNAIPLLCGESLVKGYYKSESYIVDLIKRNVLGADYNELRHLKLEVIEMQIMDIADDIAYSTYDLEDALKAGFGSPLDLLYQLNENDEIRNAVGKKLFRSETGREYSGKNAAPSDHRLFEEVKHRMLESILSMLEGYLKEVVSAFNLSDIVARETADPGAWALNAASIATRMHRFSQQIAQNGYVRAQFTSDMIGRRIRDIDVEMNEQYPSLSKVIIPPETRFIIDVLKHTTFEMHIKSHRLKTIEYRGKQIVHELFDAFDADTECELLPADWRARMRAISSFSDVKELRKRLICDYVSGMTDAYAMDVYSRLNSTNPATLFMP